MVLRRGGASGPAAVELGQAVAPLTAQGWTAAPRRAARRCDVLRGPAVAGARVSALAADGRVVAVRVEAAAAAGVLLPTAVRTGWALEAATAASDGLLSARTVVRPDGRPATEAAGRLPVDAWPPAPDGAAAAGGASGAAAAPPPVVELVLGDAGTGRVVTAEVRLPAADRCPGPDDPRAASSRAPRRGPAPR